MISQVVITRPDKVLFPRDGITKADLVAYYERAAPYMLPHLRGRLISMKRYPDGIDGSSFFQKNAPDTLPEGIRTELVEKQGGTLRQIVVDDVATLRFLANLACITPHMWLSQADRRENPDRLVLDFDPPGVGNHDVRRVAREAAALLTELGLVPFVMTSGSRGYHLHVPLDGAQGFEEVRAFARDVGRLLQARDPERLTLEVRKQKRGDRIFVDVLRNGYAQTTVAPYAVRARDGAPVATPLSLAELARSELHPQRYTLKNLFRRLARTGDPWKQIGRSRRSLAKARPQLSRMLEREGVAGRREAA